MKKGSVSISLYENSSAMIDIPEIPEIRLLPYLNNSISMESYVSIDLNHFQDIFTTNFTEFYITGKFTVETRAFWFPLTFTFPFGHVLKFNGARKKKETVASLIGASFKSEIDTLSLDAYFNAQLGFLGNMVIFQDDVNFNIYYHEEDDQKLALADVNIGKQKFSEYMTEYHLLFNLKNKESIDQVTVDYHTKKLNYFSLERNDEKCSKMIFKKTTLQYFSEIAKDYLYASSLSQSSAMNGSTLTIADFRIGTPDIELQGSYHILHSFNITGSFSDLQASVAVPEKLQSSLFVNATCSPSSATLQFVIKIPIEGAQSAVMNIEQMKSLSISSSQSYNMISSLANAINTKVPLNLPNTVTSDAPTFINKLFVDLSSTDPVSSIASVKYLLHSVEEVSNKNVVNVKLSNLKFDIAADPNLALLSIDIESFHFQYEISGDAFLRRLYNGEFKAVVKILSGILSLKSFNLPSSIKLFAKGTAAIELNLSGTSGGPNYISMLRSVSLNSFTDNEFNIALNMMPKLNVTMSLLPSNYIILAQTNVSDVSYKLDLADLGGTLSKICVKDFKLLIHGDGTILDSIENFEDKISIKFFIPNFQNVESATNSLFAQFSNLNDQEIKSFKAFMIKVLKQHLKVVTDPSFDLLSTFACLKINEMLEAFVKKEAATKQAFIKSVGSSNMNMKFKSESNAIDYFKSEFSLSIDNDGYLEMIPQASHVILIEFGETTVNAMWNDNKFSEFKMEKFEILLLYRSSGDYVGWSISKDISASLEIQSSPGLILSILTSYFSDTANDDNINVNLVGLMDNASISSSHFRFRYLQRMVQKAWTSFGYKELAKMFATDPTVGHIVSFNKNSLVLPCLIPSLCILQDSDNLPDTFQKSLSFKLQISPLLHNFEKYLKLVLPTLTESLILKTELMKINMDLDFSDLSFDFIINENHALYISLKNLKDITLSVHLKSVQVVKSLKQIDVHIEGKDVFKTFSYLQSYYTLPEKTFHDMLKRGWGYEREKSLLTKQLNYAISTRFSVKEQANQNTVQKVNLASVLFFEFNQFRRVHSGNLDDPNILEFINLEFLGVDKMETKSKAKFQIVVNLYNPLPFRVPLKHFVWEFRSQNELLGVLELKKESKTKIFLQPFTVTKINLSANFISSDTFNAVFSRVLFSEKVKIQSFMKLNNLELQFNIDNNFKMPEFDSSKLNFRYDRALYNYDAARFLTGKYVAVPGVMEFPANKLKVFNTTVLTGISDVSASFFNVGSIEEIKNFATAQIRTDYKLSNRYYGKEIKDVIKIPVKMKVFDHFNQVFKKQDPDILYQALFGKESLIHLILKEDVLVKCLDIFFNRNGVCASMSANINLELLAASSQNSFPLSVQLKSMKMNVWESMIPFRDSKKETFNTKYKNTIFYDVCGFYDFQKPVTWEAITDADKDTAFRIDLRTTFYLKFSLSFQPGLNFKLTSANDFDVTISRTDRTTLGSYIKITLIKDGKEIPHYMEIPKTSFKFQVEISYNSGDYMLQVQINDTEKLILRRYKYVLNIEKSASNKRQIDFSNTEGFISEISLLYATPSLEKTRLLFKTNYAYESFITQTIFIQFRDSSGFPIFLNNQPEIESATLPTMKNLKVTLNYQHSAIGLYKSSLDPTNIYKILRVENLYENGLYQVDFRTTEPGLYNVIVEFEYATNQYVGQIGVIYVN